MIAERVTTQAEIDAALLKEFAIRPTGEFTTDGTQQLYTDGKGRAYILPKSNQGYSYYSAADIIAHVRRKASGADIVSVHTFVTTDTPPIQLIEKEK